MCTFCRQELKRQKYKLCNVSDSLLPLTNNPDERKKHENNNGTFKNPFPHFSLHSQWEDHWSPKHSLDLQWTAAQTLRNYFTFLLEVELGGGLRTGRLQVAQTGKKQAAQPAVVQPVDHFLRSTAVSPILKFALHSKFVRLFFVSLCTLIKKA